MTCGYCGAELPSSARFCGECGRSLAQASPAPTAAETALGAAAADTPQADVAQPGTTVMEETAQSGPTGTEETAYGLDVGLDLDLDFDSDPDSASQPVSVQNAPAADAPDPWVPPRALPVQPVSEAQPGDEDLDETRIVPPTFTGHRFVLQFSTGESVTVSGTGLVGRHPVAEPAEYFDHFVTIVDPGKSVSKTHLEFGQIGNSFWISDRFSGNGTVVREPDAVPRRCEPGKRYRVVRGTRVIMGDQFFVIS